MKIQNEFPKKIYIIKDSTRIPIECEQLFVQMSPETRLKINPHTEKDTLLFGAYSINDQDEVVEDRTASLALNLGCANSLALQVYSKEIRRGERLMELPTYGYQKLFSVSNQQKNYLFEASPDKSKQDENILIIEFDDESEIRIELFQSWDVLFLDAYYIGTCQDKFVQLVLLPVASNVFRLKLIIEPADGSKG